MRGLRREERCTEVSERRSPDFGIKDKVFNHHGLGWVWGGQGIRE